MASDFSNLLLDLYRVAHEAAIDRFQDATLDLLRPLVPFDTCMWGTATTTHGQGIDIHTIHLHRTSPEMLADYAQVKHLDRAAQAMSGLPMTVKSFNADAWPDAHELREFLRRYAHENVLIAADTQPQRQFVHWISLFRADPAAYGTAQDIALLGQLAPHLMQALSMNRVLHLQRAVAAERSASAHGAAIADARGMLYHRDPLFDALVQVEWPGRCGDRLPAAVMDAAQSPPWRFTGRTLVMHGRVEHDLLFLRARARCKADSLGPREQQVARLVAGGHTYKTIAQRLERSPATVRNQIQAVYAKLEVGGVAGLIEELRRADAGPAV